MMKRREFIAALGGVTAWPLAARAQQGNRVRRIGVLMGLDENDPLAKPRVSAFTQALADLGWTVGRNLRMDLRSAGGDINRIRALAQELVGLQPDIILANSTPVTAALPGGDADDPDRLCGPGRSRRHGYRPAAQPPGREHHRLRHSGNLAGRQVASAALGDRARAQAGRNHVQSRHRPRIGCIGLYAVT